MTLQQPEPTAYEASGRGRKILVIVVLAILLVAALGFGGWAYSKMQDYKKNSDQKSALAVAQAEANQKVQLQAQFDEQSKSPNKTFTGSPTYGSITFSYPKTWSAYVDTTNSSEPINGYFNPGEVPGVATKTAFALRVELVTTDYTQVITQLSSNISQGTVTSKAYLPPKLQGIANVTPGVYMTGHVNPQDSTQNDYMVAIKVRDKTLEIYTESADFLNDFNNTVLPSLKFAP